MNNAKIQKLLEQFINSIEDSKLKKLLKKTFKSHYNPLHSLMAPPTKANQEKDLVLVSTVVNTVLHSQGKITDVEFLKNIRDVIVVENNLTHTDPIVQQIDSIINIQVSPNMSNLILLSTKDLSAEINVNKPKLTTDIKAAKIAKAIKATKAAKALVSEYSVDYEGLVATGPSLVATGVASTAPVVAPVPAIVATVALTPVPVPTAPVPVPAIGVAAPAIGVAAPAIGVAASAVGATAPASIPVRTAPDPAPVARAAHVPAVATLAARTGHVLATGHAPAVATLAARTDPAPAVATLATAPPPVVHVPAPAFVPALPFVSAPGLNREPAPFGPVIAPFGRGSAPAFSPTRVLDPVHATFGSVLDFGSASALTTSNSAFSYARGSVFSDISTAGNIILVPSQELTVPRKQNTTSLNPVDWMDIFKNIYPHSQSMLNASISALLEIKLKTQVHVSRPSIRLLEQTNISDELAIVSANASLEEPNDKNTLSLEKLGQLVKTSQLYLLSHELIEQQKNDLDQLVLIEGQTMTVFEQIIFDKLNEIYKIIGDSYDYKPIQYLLSEITIAIQNNEYNGIFSPDISRDTIHNILVNMSTNPNFKEFLETLILNCPGNDKITDIFNAADMIYNISHKIDTQICSYLNFLNITPEQYDKYLESIEFVLELNIDQIKTGINSLGINPFKITKTYRNMALCVFTLIPVDIEISTLFIEFYLLIKRYKLSKDENLESKIASLIFKIVDKGIQSFILDSFANKTFKSGDNRLVLPSESVDNRLVISSKKIERNLKLMDILSILGFSPKKFEQQFEQRDHTTSTIDLAEKSQLLLLEPTFPVVELTAPVELTASDAKLQYSIPQESQDVQQLQLVPINKLVELKVPQKPNIYKSFVYDLKQSLIDRAIITPTQNEFDELIKIEPDYRISSIDQKIFDNLNEIFKLFKQNQIESIIELLKELIPLIQNENRENGIFSPYMSRTQIKNILEKKEQYFLEILASLYQDSEEFLSDLDKAMIVVYDNSHYPTKYSYLNLLNISIDDYTKYIEIIQLFINKHSSIEPAINSIGMQFKSNNENFYIACAVFSHLPMDLNISIDFINFFQLQKKFFKLVDSEQSLQSLQSLQNLKELKIILDQINELDKKIQKIPAEDFVKHDINSFIQLCDSKYKEIDSIFHLKQVSKAENTLKLQKIIGLCKAKSEDVIQLLLERDIITQPEAEFDQLKQLEVFDLKKQSMLLNDVIVIATINKMFKNIKDKQLDIENKITILNSLLLELKKIIDKEIAENGIFSHYISFEDLGRITPDLGPVFKQSLNLLYPNTNILDIVYDISHLSNSKYSYINLFNITKDQLDYYQKKLEDLINKPENIPRKIQSLGITSQVNMAYSMAYAIFYLIPIDINILLDLIKLYYQIKEFNKKQNPEFETLILRSIDEIKKKYEINDVITTYFEEMQKLINPNIVSTQSEEYKKLISEYKINLDDIILNLKNRRVIDDSYNLLNQKNTVLDKEIVKYIQFLNSIFKKIKSEGRLDIKITKTNVNKYLDLIDKLIDDDIKKNGIFSHYISRKQLETILSNDSLEKFKYHLVKICPEIKKSDDKKKSIVDMVYDISHSSDPKCNYINLDTITVEEFNMFIGYLSFYQNPANKQKMIHDIALLGIITTDTYDPTYMIAFAIFSQIPIDIPILIDLIELSDSVREVKANRDDPEKKQILDDIIQFIKANHKINSIIRDVLDEINELIKLQKNPVDTSIFLLKKHEELQLKNKTIVDKAIKYKQESFDFILQVKDVRTEDKTIIDLQIQQLNKYINTNIKIVQPKIEELLNDQKIKLNRIISFLLKTDTQLKNIPLVLYILNLDTSLIKSIKENDIFQKDFDFILLLINLKKLIKTIFKYIQIDDYPLLSLDNIQLLSKTIAYIKTIYKLLDQIIQYIIELNTLLKSFNDLHNDQEKMLSLLKGSSYNILLRQTHVSNQKYLKYKQKYLSLKYNTPIQINLENELILNEEEYHIKYLKYKKKYLSLKNKNKY